MALGVGGFGSAAATVSRSPCSRRKEMAASELARRRESGEALSFIWSSDARRGDVGRACAPRGVQFLSRSATAALSVFLKFLIVFNDDD